MTHVLLAGDHFVLNAHLRSALADAVDTTRLELRELVLPWPIQPFGPVSDVLEASGSEDEMIEALRDVEICLTQMAPFTSRVLEASPRLKLICVGRGGPVNVNTDAARRCGVAVTYAPGRNAAATAEHTVALMLAAMRSIPQRHSELHAGKWRSDYYQYAEVGYELAGSTVGLVGCGAIGLRVARILAGFGAHVVVYDPYLDNAALAGVAEHVDSLDDLLGRSLVVSLHARLTPQTAGLMGADQIQAMRPGSILVNAARGGLLDYDALADALDAGHLSAAAVDVFPTEPVAPESRLLQVTNLVTTPHLAGASKETAHNAARMMAAEVGHYLSGRELQHVVS